MDLTGRIGIIFTDPDPHPGPADPDLSFFYLTASTA
jgi:hypothetical protein